MNDQSQTASASETFRKEQKKESPLVVVHIKHGSIEETLTGNAEEIWLLLNRFFTRLIPSFETARKLTLNVDLQTLLKDCEGVIAFADAGFHILVPRNKLTDNETLSLLLLSACIGQQLGKNQRDSLSKEELQIRLGKDAKIAGTRLSELVKGGMVSKTLDDRYKLTAFGLVQLQREILPKIKSKAVV